MPDPHCASCAHYHQFKAGEHVLVSFSDLNAGDCWHKWMAMAYRAADDKPVFKNCWVEREVNEPDTKGTILTSITDEGEVLVTMPNGRMTFMGFWQAIKFVIRAMWNGHRVEVEK